MSCASAGIQSSWCYFWILQTNDEWEEQQEINVTRNTPDDNDAIQMFLSIQERCTLGFWRQINDNTDY